MTARLTLNVWLDNFDMPAGQLHSLDTGSLQFRYSPGFLASGHPISLSLPLDDRPIGDVATRAFFDNLLPENDQMRRVIDREGLDRSDIVGILAHVGADCPGALSCLPEGEPPIKVPGNLAADYRPMESAEIEDIARRLSRHEPLPQGVDDPSPVAGVQRKIALTLLPSGEFAMPIDGLKVPTTHILKVPRDNEAREALEEDAAIQLARACGFETSRSEHVRIGGVDALLINRYDRLTLDGVVYRLHQEDFAQALGLPASLKYQRAGTSGRRFDAAAAHGVLQQLAQPALATEAFILISLFNLAIGNNDNHAKNHAVLYGIDGKPRLAPFYDLLPIKIRDKYTDQLAFDIGTASRFEDMTRDDVFAFLGAFGLAGRRAERLVYGLIRSMFLTLEQVAVNLRRIDLKLLDDLIGRELAHFDEVLGLDLDLRERDYFGARGGGWLAMS